MDLDDKQAIEGMAEVMAKSIIKLLEPCIKQRCKQFLTLLREEDALVRPSDRGFGRHENNEGDT